MLETLMPLVANDETELSDFVDKVLPNFKRRTWQCKTRGFGGINTKEEKSNRCQQQRSRTEKKRGNKGIRKNKLRHAKTTDAAEKKDGRHKKRLYLKGEGERV